MAERLVAADASPLIGLAGVLLAAKRAGFISRVSPLLERLEGSNFRLSEEVIRTVLEQAGETPAR